MALREWVARVESLPRGAEPVGEGERGDDTLGDEDGDRGCGDDGERGVECVPAGTADGAMEGACARGREGGREGGNCGVSEGLRE